MADFRLTQLPSPKKPLYLDMDFTINEERQPRKAHFFSGTKQELEQYLTKMCKDGKKALIIEANPDEEAEEFQKEMKAAFHSLSQKRVKKVATPKKPKLRVLIQRPYEHLFPKTIGEAKSELHFTTQAYFPYHKEWTLEQLLKKIDLSTPASWAVTVEDGRIDSGAVDKTKFVQDHLDKTLFELGLSMGDTRPSGQGVESSLFLFHLFYE